MFFTFETSEIYFHTDVHLRDHWTSMPWDTFKKHVHFLHYTALMTKSSVPLVLLGSLNCAQNSPMERGEQSSLSFHPNQLGHANHWNKEERVLFDTSTISMNTSLGFKNLSKMESHAQSWWPDHITGWEMIISCSAAVGLSVCGIWLIPVCCHQLVLIFGGSSCFASSIDGAPPPNHSVPGELWIVHTFSLPSYLPSIIPCNVGLAMKLSLQYYADWWATGLAAMSRSWCCLGQFRLPKYSPSMFLCMHNTSVYISCTGKLV